MSLTELVQEKLQAGECKNVNKLLRDTENEALLHAENMNIVSTLIGNMSEENLRSNFELFSVCEDLLKFVAGKCAPQEVLLELLEKLEITKNDEIFTSLLKALQIVLLRLNENKARSLEWSLNSVLAYVEAISLPDFISNIGVEEEKLLECDTTIQRILQLYITILLFLEPIIKEFNKEKNHIFEATGNTRRNIAVCFVLQLMGKPLVYLNVHQPITSCLNITKSGERFDSMFSYM